MNNKHILDLTVRLSHALDKNYDVVNMAAVMSVITELEGTTITKEQLEATRLAKYINQLRRRTKCEQLARRAKSLLKKWREMVGIKQQQPQSTIEPPVLENTAVAAEKDVGRCEDIEMMAASALVTGSSLTISANTNIYNNCSNSNRVLDIIHTDGSARHAYLPGDSSSGNDADLVSYQLHPNDNMNRQRISFANIFKGRCNDGNNSGGKTKPQQNKHQGETYVVDQSSNSNSNVTYMPAPLCFDKVKVAEPKKYVPEEIVIDIQDSNSGQNIIEIPATSTKINTNDSSMALLPKMSARTIKVNRDNNNAKRSRKYKKRDKECDMFTNEKHQNEQLMDSIDDTSASLNHGQQKHGSRINEVQGITPSETRLLSNPTPSIISEVLSLSNSSVSLMFPNERLGAVVPLRADDQPAKHDLNLNLGVKKDLTFSGKFKHQGGCNIEPGEDFGMSGRHQMNADVSSNTINDRNVVEERVPKKRGRKKGSRGVDSVISKEASLSSQILISPLSSCGKKVKTTKELYVEMQNRKLGSIPRQITSPLSIIPTNCTSNIQSQTQQLSRPASSCSETSLNSPRTLDACSTNATTSTLATRSTPDNFLSHLQIDDAESDTLTSGEPSRDSNVIQKSSHRQALSIDSNSNTLLPNTIIRDMHADTRNPTVSISSNVPKQKRLLPLLSLEKQLSNLLSQLAKIPVNAATSTNEGILCTCKIIEITSRQQDDEDAAGQSIQTKTGGEGESEHSLILINQINNACAHGQQQQPFGNDIRDQFRASTSTVANLESSEQLAMDKVEKTKLKKSIFDLDFDDGDDPLHKLVAEVAAIRRDSLGTKDNNQAITEVNMSHASDTTTEIDRIQPPVAHIFSQMSGVDSSDVIAPKVPYVLPVYQVLSDPECKAKKRFEIQTQDITEFHVNALHNCYIPNVNGNWDYGGNILDEHNNAAMDNLLSTVICDDDDSTVIPKYGALVNHRLRKDLSFTQLSQNFKLNKQTRIDLKTQVFLGVAPGLLTRKCLQKSKRPQTISTEHCQYCRHRSCHDIKTECEKELPQNHSYIHRGSSLPLDVTNSHVGEAESSTLLNANLKAVKMNAIDQVWSNFESDKSLSVETACRKSIKRKRRRSQNDPLECHIIPGERFTLAFNGDIATQSQNSFDYNSSDNNYKRQNKTSLDSSGAQSSANAVIPQYTIIENMNTYPDGDDISYNINDLDNKYVADEFQSTANEVGDFLTVINDHKIYKDSIETDEEYEDVDYDGDFIHEVVPQNSNSQNGHIVLTIKKTLSKINSPAQSKASSNISQTMNVIKSIEIPEISNSNQCSTSKEVREEKLNADSEEISESIENNETSNEKCIRTSLCENFRNSSSCLKAFESKDTNFNEEKAELNQSACSERQFIRQTQKMHHLLFFPHELHWHCDNSRSNSNSYCAGTDNIDGGVDELVSASDKQPFGSDETVNTNRCCSSCSCIFENSTNVNSIGDECPTTNIKVEPRSPGNIVANAFPNTSSNSVDNINAKMKKNILPLENNRMLLSFNSISSSANLPNSMHNNSTLYNMNQQDNLIQSIDHDLCNMGHNAIYGKSDVDVYRINEKLALANESCIFDDDDHKSNKQQHQLKLPPKENCDVYKKINDISNNTSSNNKYADQNISAPPNINEHLSGEHNDDTHNCNSKKYSPAKLHNTPLRQQQNHALGNTSGACNNFVTVMANDMAVSTMKSENFNAATKAQIKPHQEYLTGLRAVDEDVHDDDGNNCARIQQFKEWHEVLQLRSYNDELLTVLPYVVLE